MVRREEEGIRRYVHLGTGNYNDSTAKLYTDCGLLTCDPLIGEDATAVFNMLSGYSGAAWLEQAVAGAAVAARTFSAPDPAGKRATPAKVFSALIVAKMNSLCDREIIAESLYEASNAG